jgi:hypothetical protein
VPFRDRIRHFKLTIACVCVVVRVGDESISQHPQLVRGSLVGPPTSEFAEASILPPLLVPCRDGCSTT